MADELHLDEFQAYLLTEDRSPMTITGYIRVYAELAA